MFSDTTAPETLRTLAEQYAAACDELNERMKYCGGFLRQGNLAEAVRLAETEPPLLDIYNILDFPEREEWCDVTALLGYPIPPPLQKEFAKELNDAYDSQHLLEPHLRKYRLAALSRAPLTERLGLLREIAVLDPSNTFWIKDQETFEQLRLPELETEIRAAIKENNIEQLKTLQNELSQSWALTPPVTLVFQIESVLQNNLLKNVARQMWELAELLLNAHVQFDVNQGRMIYQNLCSLQTQYNFPVPQDVVKMTQGAVNWLQEDAQQQKNLHQYEAIRNQMVAAMKVETPLPELQRLYQQLQITAQNASVEIPEEITDAFEQNVDMQELQHRRRTRWITISAIFVSLVVVSMAGLFVYAYTQHKIVADTVIALKKLEEEGNSENISKYLKANEAKLSTMQDGEAAFLLTKLQQMVEDAERRKKRFADIQQELTQMIDANDVSRPSLVSELGRLATTEEERTILESLRGKYQRIERDRKNQVDKNLLARWSLIQKEIQNPANNKNLSPNEIKNKKREWILSLESLVNEYPNATSGHLERCKKTIADLQMQIDQIDLQNALQQNIQTLVSNIGYADLFKTRLSGIIKKFPDNNIVKQMEMIQDEWNAIEMLLKYDELCRLLSNFRLLEKSAPEDANKFSKILQTFTNTFVDYSSENFAIQPDEINLITAIAKRPISQNEIIFAKTTDILTDLKTKPFWVLFTSQNSTWYYVTRKPNNPGSYNYATSDYATPTPKRFDKEFFENLPKKTQTDIAEHGLTILEQIEQKNWTLVCASLIHEVYSADGVDPILKYSLMKTMIADFSEYDAIIAKNYQPILLNMNNKTLDEYVNRMNAESSPTTKARQQALDVLAKIRLPKPEQIKETFAKYAENESFVKPYRFRWIGFLNRDLNNWKCELKSDDDIEGELYIVRRQASASSNNNGYSLVHVGNIGTKQNIQLFDNPNMLQCAPVFVKVGNE
jgi:hypothetical protein